MDDLKNIFKNNPIPTASPPILDPFASGGNLIAGILEIAIYAAGFLAFFYLVWGAFQYIMASGKKEELQKARSRMTYAIIGLMVVLLAFFIMKYASEFFTPQVTLPAGNIEKGWLPF